MRAVENNPAVAAQTRIGKIANTISKTGSLFSKGVPIEEFRDFVSQLGKLENSGALLSFVMNGERTASPEKIRLMRNILPHNVRQKLDYEFFNELLFNGRSEVDLPALMQDISRLTSTESRTGVHPETIRAFAGDKGFEAFKSAALAFKRLHSLGPVAENETFRRFAQRLDQAPPGYGNLLTAIRSAGANVLSAIPIAFLLTNNGINVNSLRGLTAAAYATISKMKGSPETKKENK
jgi:hypothetical protein